MNFPSKKYQEKMKKNFLKLNSIVLIEANYYKNTTSKVRGFNVTEDLEFVIIYSYYIIFYKWN